MSNSLLELDAVPPKSWAWGQARTGEIPALQLDHVTLVLSFSLLLLLATWDKSVYMLSLGLVACGLALVRAPLLHDPRFWLAICAGQAVRNWTAWMLLDDHIYVANYWTLAIALALMSQETQRVLSHHGRWLIALIFLFATAWKAMSSEYTSGAFFEYTLLLDDRFLPLAKLCGLSGPQLAENYHHMAAMRDPDLAIAGFELNSSSRLQGLAYLLTWWTVIIEGAIAVCFFCASIPIFRAIRNPLLLLFAATTYLPVPVGGFCTTLMVLGLAQCGENERRSRIAYAIGFFVILVWAIVWRELIYIF